MLLIVQRGGGEGLGGGVSVHDSLDEDGRRTLQVARLLVGFIGFSNTQAKMVIITLAHCALKSRIDFCSSQFLLYHP